MNIFYKSILYRCRTVLLAMNHDQYHAQTSPVVLPCRPLHLQIIWQSQPLRGFWVTDATQSPESGHFIRTGSNFKTWVEIENGEPSIITALSWTGFQWGIHFLFSSSPHYRICLFIVSLTLLIFIERSVIFNCWTDGRSYSRLILLF